eukprot:UN07851
MILIAISSTLLKRFETLKSFQELASLYINPPVKGISPSISRPIDSQVVISK